jgi:predicted DCC family thiol-disulfide oxidoreductase YuxK
MSEPIGFVLYDDSCGFCRRWIPFWETTLRKRGFAIAPLQSDWVVEQLNVSEEDLLFDLRLLLANGDQVRGADVYRYVMRRIWWTYPLYILSSLPLLRNVFDWGYRTFANNRYRFSRSCQLPPSTESRVGSTDNKAMHSDARGDIASRR